MKIQYANGSRAEVDSVAAVLAAIPGSVASDDNNDRVLIWASEQEAENDDGSRAIAVITLEAESEGGK